MYHTIVQYYGVRCGIAFEAKGLKPKKAVAKLAAANVVPPKLVPKVVLKTLIKHPQKENLFRRKDERVVFKIRLKCDRKLGRDRKDRDGSLDQGIQFSFCLG